MLQIHATSVAKRATIVPKGTRKEGGALEQGESFSATARRLKSQSDITIRELATACFISESTTSRYLNGQIVPPKETADRMIQTLRAARVMDDPPLRIESEDVGQALKKVEGMYLERIQDIQATLE